MIYIGVIFWADYRRTKQIAKLKADREAPGYVAKQKLDEICWVKALKRLEHIYQNPEITEACMLIGTQDGKGHAWIEYRRGTEVIQYDPTTEKVISIKETTCLK